MRALVLRTVAISAAVLAGAPACASDDGSSAKPGPDAGAETGAHKGSGGKATGGAGGSGAAGASSGGAGAGGAPGGCDTSSCDQLVSSFSALGIKSCCVSKTQCGIDVGSFFGGGGGTQCVDPTAFTPPGTTPPNVTVLDGGIVPVQGGLPIQLDPTCPDVVAQGAFDMPGCCRPSTGTCGGSTHTLSGAGDTVPLYCASYDEIASAAASTFGNMVVVPDDPNIKCKYTAAPTGIPDAAAGGSGGTVGIDAGTMDAGTGGAAGGGAAGGGGTSGVAGSGGTAESGGTAGSGDTGGTAGAGGTGGTAGAAGSGGGGTAGAAGSGGGGTAGTASAQ